MGLVDRAKNILLTPATEWSVIAGEPATPASLITGYALPFMLIAPVMTLIGTTLLSGIIGGLVGHVGLGTGVGVGFGLGLAIVTFVFAILTVIGLALLVNALAPSFGGEQNTAQAFKLAVYASTAAWLGGFLLILPGLGWLLMFVAALYSYYTFYLGLPVLMKCPKEKTLSYFLVIVVAWIVVAYVFRRIAFSTAVHF